MSKPVRRSGEKVWKPLTLCTWSSKMKERGEQRGNIWEINDKELFRFDKDMSLHIQKAQYSLNMLIRNNLILMHCSKMAERQNQENLFTANRKLSTAAQTPLRPEAGCHSISHVACAAIPGMVGCTSSQSGTHCLCTCLLSHSFLRQHQEKCLSCCC